MQCVVLIAGWSSPVARQAHNLKAAGSNPAPATKSLHQYIKGIGRPKAGFAFKSPNIILTHFDALAPQQAFLALGLISPR